MKKSKKVAQVEEYKRVPKAPKTKEQIHEEFKEKQRAQSKIQLEVDRKLLAKTDRKKKYEALRIAEIEAIQKAKSEIIISIPMAIKLDKNYDPFSVIYQPAKPEEITVASEEVNTCEDVVAEETGKDIVHQSIDSEEAICVASCEDQPVINE